MRFENLRTVSCRYNQVEILILWQELLPETAPSDFRIVVTTVATLHARKSMQ